MSSCPKCQTRISSFNERKKHRCNTCRSWITEDGELYKRKVPDTSSDYDCDVCGRRLRPALDFYGASRPHNVRTDGSTGGPHECRGEEDKPEPPIISGGRPESNRRKF